MKNLAKIFRRTEEREEILNPTCFLCLFHSACGFEEREGCAGPGAALSRGPSWCSAPGKILMDLGIIGADP